ncbi:Conotoxin-like peptide 2 [Basidiobolus meristosporus CBS 931.73]|uniref:Conotoxin-like peptide 2 n=1 Tax=Basidiobolus meristosporus CBS 931.73 TaxID=1314790 RepID=A0A1Y1X4D9_9FUNG|nr:Conotoxin-like peptide 2 [Basidiobolus meristosporus CBS 931.73]|eukprot:ORX80508.1 Conotoxin-like peptide 2 [Basidiobolus meristosporus CBS 931.73]
MNFKTFLLGALMTVLLASQSEAACKKVGYSCTSNSQCCSNKCAAVSSSNPMRACR